MECVAGKIMSGNAVVADGVELWLARSGDGPTDWSGTVELPAGAHLDEATTYRLELEDGRSGNVMVTNVGGPDDATHTVGFRGAGPLG